MRVVPPLEQTRVIMFYGGVCVHGERMKYLQIKVAILAKLKDWHDCKRL